MLDLEPIKVRHAAATRGVWLHLPHLGGVFADIKDLQGILAVATPPQYDDRPDDMEFIAAAHRDIPALIAEVERLRAIVDAQRSAVAEQGAQIAKLITLAKDCS